MADNFITNPAAGGTTFAGDDISGVMYQRVKKSLGADGSATDEVAAPVSGNIAGSTGVPLAAGAIWDTTAAQYVIQQSARSSNAGDGNTGAYLPNAVPNLYNEVTFDRQRGNTIGTALASAARTTVVSSPTLPNWNARGVQFTFSISAAGTGSLSLYVQGSSDNGTSWLFPTQSAVAAVPITTTGDFGTLWYPGGLDKTDVATGTNYQSRIVNAPVPRNFRAYVVPSGSSSWTYSLTYALIL